MVLALLAAASLVTVVQRMLTVHRQALALPRATVGPTAGALTTSRLVQSRARLDDREDDADA